MAIYGSKVGRGSCLFIDNVAAVNEGRQSMEDREQYVPSKIKHQFRAETNRMQACELNLLVRLSEEMSNSDNLFLSVTNL